MCLNLLPFWIVEVGGRIAFTSKLCRSERIQMGGINSCRANMQIWKWNWSCSLEKPLLILKVAKVVPVLKADDPSLIENYRAISILPAFSKILKKIGYNRISRYLTENMILSNNWFFIRDAECLLLADDTSIFYQKPKS